MTDQEEVDIGDRLHKIELGQELMLAKFDAIQKSYDNVLANQQKSINDHHGVIFGDGSDTHLGLIRKMDAVTAMASATRSADSKVKWSLIGGVIAAIGEYIAMKFAGGHP